MSRKKFTTNALEIMDTVFGAKDLHWKERVEREHQNFALGEVIRQAREARGWSQKDLARKAGTSQSYISRIEDADYDRLMIAILDKLAKTLDLPLTITLGSQTVQLQPA